MNTPKKLAILSYHKIGPPPDGAWESWYYISAETFADQLRLLRVHDYEPIDLARLYAGLDNADALPAKAALITFDDGYRNNLTHGLPVLREHGFPGVIFVPTKFIGGNNEWDSGHEPTERICDWDELRELERGGLTVEAHSVSHPAFSTLSIEQQRDELKKSKEVLEAGLNRAVECFAYPFGDFGGDVEAARRLLAETGYRAGCLYGGDAIVTPGIDRFQLPRLAMGPDSDLAGLLGESL